MLRFRWHKWGIFQAISKPISEKFGLCRRSLAGFVGIDCGELEGEDEDDVWGGWAGMFCRGYCLKFIAFVMLLLCVRIFYTKKKDAVLLYVDGSCLSFLSRKDQIISSNAQQCKRFFFLSKKGLVHSAIGSLSSAIHQTTAKTFNCILHGVKERVHVLSRTPPVAFCHI